MKGIVFGKRGSWWVVIGSVIMIITLALLAYSLLIPKRSAHAAVTTANEFTDEIGLDDLIDLAIIKSISFSVDENTGALNVNWVGNSDAEKAISNSADVRVTFLHRELPWTDLKAACVGFRVGTYEVPEPGFTCGVNPGGSMAWITATAGPAPSGEYVVAVAIKKSGDVGFGESKEGSYKFFTNELIETYRYVSGTDDACKEDCDVVGKKEAALGNDDLGWKTVPDKTEKPEETYVYIARCGDSVPRFNGDLTDCGDNGGKFLGSCQLDTNENKKGEERITGCTEKEVDMMYVDVVTAYYQILPKEAFPEDKPDLNLLLSVDCNRPEAPLNRGWMDREYERYKENGIKAVCDAKNRLMSELEKANWVDLSR